MPPRPILAASVLRALIGGASMLGCSTTCGDCPSDVDGLVITVAVPITKVTLSGPACSGGRFRCVPADFDDVVHDPCTEVQIEAAAEGLCAVDLTLGADSVHLERQMTRRPPGCCGGFIGEANHAGEIDLTSTDGGMGGDASGLDRG